MFNTYLKKILFPVFFIICLYQVTGEDFLLNEQLVQTVQGKLNQKKISKVITAYVDWLEQYYRKFEIQQNFIAWLQLNPKIRKTFWLALSPERDNIHNAAKILDELRKQYPEKIKKFYHLAIAIAVVWDTPKTIEISQKYIIWKIKPEQFLKPIGYQKIFDLFTNPKFSKYFVFQPDKLVWPLLVHVVDFDITLPEFYWALNNYRSKKRYLQQIYQEVQYDYQKVTSNITKLGKRPYTLPNILKYGGICGDQAHFASRVAKCFCIPSMKVYGQNLYGGLHAWAGFLSIKRGVSQIVFTGRYRYDHYYTGYLYDPKNLCKVLDRSTAIILDGAAISYKNYINAQALVKIAQQNQDKHPQLCLKLVKYALKTNYYCKAAWKSLMMYIRQGYISKKEGLQWFNLMIRKLREYPDITIECLETFIGCIPKKDLRKRFNLYEQMLRIYSKRPDLQVRLRIKECDEFVRAKKISQGLSLGLSTCIINAKDGSVIMPLFKKCAQIIAKYKLYRQTKYILQKIKKRFPKQRYGAANFGPAYLELKKIIDSLGLGIF